MSLFGQIALGWLSDRYPTELIAAASTTASTLVVLVMWGHSYHKATLNVFALSYGFVAASYSVLWCRFVTSFSNERTTGLWLYSILECQRGFGSIIGGFVAALLIQSDVISVEYGLGAYRNIILFVGVSMGAASLVVFGWRGSIRLIRQTESVSEFAAADSSEST
jgi:MFS family permease